MSEPIRPLHPHILGRRWSDAAPVYSIELTPLLLPDGWLLSCGWVSGSSILVDYTGEDPWFPPRVKRPGGCWDPIDVFVGEV